MHIISPYTGVIESLNYQGGSGSPYLANTRYSVCVRAHQGMCGMRLRAEVGQFIFNSNKADNIVNNGTECHKSQASRDFIQVIEETRN